MAFDSHTVLLALASANCRWTIFPRSACVVSVAFSPLAGAFLIALGILLIIIGAIAILT